MLVISPWIVAGWRAQEIEARARESLIVVDGLGPAFSRRRPIVVKEKESCAAARLNASAIAHHAGHTAPRNERRCGLPVKREVRHFSNP
jgi:hypothetical protein